MSTTRFYWSSTDGHAVSPAFAAWTRTSEGLRCAISETKDASAMTDKTAGSTGFYNPGANETALIRQGISPPMAAGCVFTIGVDSAKMVVRGKESATDDNINRTPICLKIVSEDGSTLRATLLSLAHYGASTTEWPTTLTNRQALNGDALMASYTTVSGDRIVCESGFQVSGSGGTGVLGTMSFGSSSASDLAENETGTAADNPWIEITTTLGTITFLSDDDDGVPRIIGGKFFN